MTRSYYAVSTAASIGILVVALAWQPAISAPVPKESPTLRLKLTGEIKLKDQTIDEAAVIDETSVVVVGTVRDSEESPEPDTLDPQGAILDLTKKTQQPFTNGHTRRIWSVSVSGARIATTSSHLDPVLRVWDLKTKKSFAEIDIETEKSNNNSVRYHVAGFHKSNRIAVSAGNRVIVLDPAKPDDRVEHSAIDSSVLSGGLVVSPDDSRIASTTLGGLIAVWKVGTDQPTALSVIPEKLQANDHWFARTLVFGPKETLVASRTGDNLSEIPEASLEKDVSAARRGVVQFDLGNQKMLPLKIGHTDRTLACALDPTGTWLATGGASRSDKPLGNGDLIVGELRVYHLPTATIDYKVQMGDGSLCWIAFTPSGKRIVSATTDGVVRWWDVEGK